MKKLKTLCAIVGAAAMLYSGAAFAAKQKYDVPNYDLKGAETKTEYAAITPFGVMPLNNPSESQGFPVVTMNKYFVDRNNDKKADLVQLDLLVPEMEIGEGKTQQGYTVKQLYIDDDFNGYIDRMLTDQTDETGKAGADGIYEAEQHALKIEDLRVSGKR